MRSYGETRKKLDEAARHLVDVLVDDPEAEFPPEARVAVAAAHAQLAAAYATLELAFEIDRLAVEVKRNTHLR